MKPVENLKSSTNSFGGVIVKPESLPKEPNEFRTRLSRSLTEWQIAGLNLVWLELRMNMATLIPTAVESGFSYHHTGNNYIMLTYCLVENAFVPPFASHYIGAGGVVVNKLNELLVVHEKGGKPGDPRHYKLPGGAVREGEHLADGVVREVLEETGIRTCFESIICFRNMHRYRYDKSDIYFVCRLKPQTHKITMQTEEIEECLWMPLDQYFSSTNVSTFNKRIVQTSLENSGFTPTAIDGYRDPEQVEIFSPSSFV